MIQGFDPKGRRAKLSSYCGRVIDVMEELVKFTLRTRDLTPYLLCVYLKKQPT
jgi:arsenic resistance protein ArsH